MADSAEKVGWWVCAGAVCAVAGVQAALASDGNGARVRPVLAEWQETGAGFAAAGGREGLFSLSGAPPSTGGPPSGAGCTRRR